MLDMGFIHDVKKILALVPKDKQSLLFSATFSDEIRELANNLLKDPQSIQVTPSNTTVQRITQVVHPVGRGKKKALLAHIINEHNWSQVWRQQRGRVLDQERHQRHGAAWQQKPNCTYASLVRF
jgi:ATP-dependent RNA helicase RhlE